MTRFSTLLSVLVVATAASGQIAPRVTQPLSAKVLAPGGFVATPAPEDLALVSGELGAATLADVAAFKSAAGPDWSFYVDRRSGGMALVQGQGIPWVAGEPSIAELEVKARELMSSYPNLFQAPLSELVLDRRGSVVFGENNQFAAVVFNQVINGVPVDSSRIGFYISHGNLVMFGVDRIVSPLMPVRSMTPVFTADQARAAFVTYLGGLQAGDVFYEDASLRWVLRGAGDGVATGIGTGWDADLMYRFVFGRGQISNWEVLVSATTGNVVRFVDANRYASVLAKASVLRVTNCTDPLNCSVVPGAAVFPGSQTEVRVTMPYLKLNFAGGTCTGDGCYTNGGGSFDYPAGAAAVAATMEGKYFRIVDACGATAVAAAAPASFDFGSSDPLPWPGNSDCASGNRQSSPDTAPTSAGSGNTHSARATYYHINLIAAKSRFFLPTNEWLKGAGGSRGVVNVTTNLPPACNAFWQPATGTLNFMRLTPAPVAVAVCNNTGEIPSVFLHEYGHGLDSNDGTGAAPEGGTGEAMGDTFALLEGQQPCIGTGFLLLDPSNSGFWVNKAGYGSDTAGSSSRHCSGVRSLDYREFCSRNATACVNRDADAPNGSRSGVSPGLTATDVGTPARYNHMIDAAAAGADGQSNFYDCGGPASACAGPLTMECHCESMISSQSNWDLTKLLIENVFGGNIYTNPQGPTEVAGWQYMDRLWYLTRDTATSAYVASGPNPAGVTSGCTATGWFSQYRLVDDDNGNLADGTPHADLIFAAFDRHAIACGTATDASNLSSGRGSRPAAPVLNACSTSAPVQFTWASVPGATKYRVLRNTLGCGFGFTPIKTVTGSNLYYEDGDIAPGIPYFYRLQAIGANDSVYGGVSDCVTVTPATCTPTAVPAPTNTVATSTANNQITVSWNPSAGATLYKVLRKEGACSSTNPYTPIGIASGTTLVDDSGLVGSKSYSYQVTAANAACASCTSAASACTAASTAVATGACLVPPTFGGATSVFSSVSAGCRLTVRWAPAVSNCGPGSFTYAIYRDTAPNFLPGAGTLLASGLATTEYVDSSVTGGTRYYYIVRATDGRGNTDLNVVRRGETATGRLLNTPFSDNGGDSGAVRFALGTPSSGTWAIRVGEQTQTPAAPGANTTKLYATTPTGSYGANACQALESETISLGSNPILNFRTKYYIEQALDGGIVEVATENGGFTNWTKLTTIKYPGVMGSPLGGGCANPGFAPGQQAFTSTSPGEQWVAFDGSLSAYANQRIRVRFVFSSDAPGNDGLNRSFQGWFLDDISVTDSKVAGICGVNTPPIAVQDSATTRGGEPVTINVLGNDAEADGDLLKVGVSAQPASGTATVNGGDNSITYTPAAGFVGTDSFTYQIDDGQGGISTATVDVTVDAPSTVPMVFSRSVISDHSALGGEPLIRVDRRADLNQPDQVYVSFPFGVSTTASMIVKSIDGGRTFLPLGAPATEDAVIGPGGGDTHQDFDGQHRLYYVDLSAACVTAAVSNDGGNSFPPEQTNYATCVGTGAPTAPTDDRQWVAGFGDGIGYVTVRNFNGSNFFMFKTSDAGRTWDEGRMIGSVAQSGPLQIDKTKRKVVVNGQVKDAILIYQIYRSGSNSARMWRITDLDDGSPLIVDDFLVANRPGSVANVFVVAAVDTAGNVYATWSEGTTKIMVTRSTDRGATWSAPVQVNTDPALASGTNIMPWIVAGSPGRIDVTWYHSNLAGNPEDLASRWDNYMAQSLDIFSANPTFNVVKVNDTAIHSGQICLGGLNGCDLVVPMRDRSFLEFPSIDVGSNGEAFITFNQNTNQAKATYVMVGRQSRGLSLFENRAPLFGTPGSVTVTSPAPDANITSRPLTVSGTHTLPPLNFDKDDIADARFPNHGVTIGANQPAFDLRQVSLSDDATNITVKMTVADLTTTTLAAAPPQAGADGILYLTQWQFGDKIFWVGAEIRGGQPLYRTGTLAAIKSATSNKYVTYNPDPTLETALVGTITNTAPGTITIKIPRSQLTGLANGNAFHQVTGYAYSERGPLLPVPTDQAPNPDSFPVMVDTSSATSYVVGSGPRLDGVVELSLDDQSFASPIIATTTGDPTVASTWTAQIDLPLLTDGAHTIYARQRIGSTVPSAAVPVAINVGLPPVSSIQFTDAALTVGEAAGTATITVARVGASAGTAGISYATSNGTASAGSDYAATSGTLSWADGDTAAKTITIPITNDTVAETPETVLITLSNPTGTAALGTPFTSTLTIADDDLPGALQFSLPAYAAGEGSTTATVTVTRTGGAAGAVSVNYSTTNGTGSDGADYTASSGILNWSNGDTAAKTFTVTILEDTASEGDETVNLSLSNPTGGATLGLSSAVLTIIDNDGLRVTTLSPPSVCQGGPDFTLTVDGSNFDSGAVVTVNGSPRDTTVLNGSRLTARLRAGDIASPGSISIVVVNGDNSSSNTASLAVTTDAEPPAVTPPASITILQSMCAGTSGGATGNSATALAAFLAGGTAIDGCSPSTTRLVPQVEGTDASNATVFHAGETSVTFRFSDKAGHVGTATSSVTVRLFGDLDLDGLVTATDLVIMANHLVGNLSAPADVADVNHDQSVDAVDFVVHANYLVGNIACLSNP